MSNDIIQGSQKSGCSSCSISDSSSKWCVVAEPRPEGRSRLPHQSPPESDLFQFHVNRREGGVQRYGHDGYKQTGYGANSLAEWVKRYDRDGWKQMGGMGGNRWVGYLGWV